MTEKERFEQAKSHANAELEIEKYAFDRTVDALGGIPGRAAPILAASLVLLGFTADYIAKLAGRVWPIWLVILGIAAFLAFVTCLWFCCVSIQDAKMQDGPVLPQIPEEKTIDGQSDTEQVDDENDAFAFLISEQMERRTRSSITEGRDVGHAAFALLFQASVLEEWRGRMVRTLDKAMDQLMGGVIALVVLSVCTASLYVLRVCYASDTADALLERQAKDAAPIVIKAASSAEHSAVTASSAMHHAEDSERSSKTAASAAQKTANDLYDFMSQ